MDPNYKKIMTEAFDRFDGEEYDGTVEEMAQFILQSLKRKYHVVDKNGASINDNEALKSTSLLLSFISFTEFHLTFLCTLNIFI